MVAPLVSFVGVMVALQQTFLTGAGRKADVPIVKKLMPAAGSLAGASIPLGVARNGCIGIAEGIETALASWLASGLPTVAAYSASNMAAWQWPSDVSRVAIFADSDAAGLYAAEKLSARAHAARLQSEVLAPATADVDWCDVWCAREQAIPEPGVEA